MSKETGGPAFPVPFDVYPDGEGSAFVGMRLRDYFAAKAMQSSVVMENSDMFSKEDHAIWAYEMADAMLEARK